MFFKCHNHISPTEIGLTLGQTDLVLMRLQLGFIQHLYTLKGYFTLKYIFGTF